jgi:hypothetical protein
MKQLVIVFASIIFLSVGCKKDAPKYPVDNTPKGYLVVQCENCTVDYGMPDQYKMLTVSGTSPKAPFSYKAGYTLYANLIAINKDQEMTLTVYDTEGKVIYTGSDKREATKYWPTATLLE